MELIFYFFAGFLSMVNFFHIPWFLCHFSAYKKSHSWKQHFCTLVILCLFIILPINQFSYHETELFSWLINFILEILFRCFCFFVITYFIYKNAFSSSIISIILLFFSQILSTLIVIFIHYLIALFSFTIEFSIFSSLRTILLNLLMISSLRFFVYFFQKHPLQSMNNKKNVYLIFLVILTIVLFFLLFPTSGLLMSNVTTSSKLRFHIILIGSIFLVDIIFLPFILKLIRDAHLESILDTLQEEVKKELDYYNTLENQLAQMRKIRHDFNNQLQTAYMLLENPNLEISSIPDHSKLLSTPQFCENKILDFILQSSYSHAKELGISLDFDVVVPDSIGVENIDLCSIFSNLLNNAIHAAQKTENPFISLKVSYSNNELIVELSNTTLEKELEYRDPKFHGYGLLILNDLAKKYNGNFSTQKKKGIFYAYFSIFVHS